MRLMSVPRITSEQISSEQREGTWGNTWSCSSSKLTKIYHTLESFKITLGASGIGSCAKIFLGQHGTKL